MGALFLAGASMVASTRVFVGLHYPGDVGGGALIGLVSALIVFFTAGGRFIPIVRALSRLTDPLAAPAWRARDAYKARRRIRSSALSSDSAVGSNSSSRSG